MYNFGVNNTVSTQSIKNSYNFGVSKKEEPSPVIAPVVEKQQELKSPIFSRFTEPIKNLFKPKLSTKKTTPEGDIISFSPELGGGQFIEDKKLARDVSPELANKIRGGSFADKIAEVNHIVSLGIGGTNEPSNLAPVESRLNFINATKKFFGIPLRVEDFTLEERQAGRIPLETELAKQVKSGKITQEEAIVKEKGFDFIQEQLSQAKQELPGQVIQDFKDFWSSVAPQTTENVSNLINAIKNPPSPLDAIKAPIDYVNSIVETGAEELDRIKEFFTPSTTSVSKKSAEGLKVLTGGAGVLFSPITALFSASKNVPVVNIIAEVASLPFSASGDIGTVDAQLMLESLPLQEETKVNLKDAIGEVGALAAQIVIGGKVMETITRPKLEAKYTKPEVDLIVKKANEKADATIAENTQPKTVVLEALKTKNQVEQIANKVKTTPREFETSVVQKINQKTGEKSFQVIPRGQLQEFINLIDNTQQGIAGRPINDVVYHLTASSPEKMISAGFKNEGIAKLADIPVTERVLPKSTTVSREQLPVGSGEKRVSRLESRVKDTLDKATPDSINELGLSTYKQLNKRDNINAAAEFIAKTSEKEILDILKGKTEAPKGILTNSIYVAMIERAKGDVTLATKLASLRATRLGQELSILAEIDPNSPIKIMNDVVKIREQAAVRITKSKNISEARTKIANEIKSKIEPPKFNDFKSFVESIKC